MLQSPRVMQDREKPEDGAPPLHTRIESEKVKPANTTSRSAASGGRWRFRWTGRTGRRSRAPPAAWGFWRSAGRLPALGRRPVCVRHQSRLRLLRLPRVHAAARSEPQAQGAGLCRDPRRGTAGPRPRRDADRRRPHLRRVAASEGRSREHRFRCVPAHAGAASQKLNQTPLSQTTDFVDERPVADVRNEYVVVPVAGPDAGKPSAVAGAVPSERGQNYLSIKLNGDHTFQKCGIADLNGDGVYDYVIKQPSANIDPYENVLAAQSRDLQDRGLSGATARSCGVTTWAGRSSGESGIRPWSSTTWMATAGPKSA